MSAKHEINVKIALKNRVASTDPKVYLVKSFNLKNKRVRKRDINATFIPTLPNATLYKYLSEEVKPA